MNKNVLLFFAKGTAPCRTPIEGAVPIGRFTSLARAETKIW